MGEEIRAKDIIPIFQVFMAMFQARFCTCLRKNMDLFNFTKSAIKPVTGRRIFESKTCLIRYTVKKVSHFPVLCRDVTTH